jgi:hypothetical protein
MANPDDERNEFRESLVVTEEQAKHDVSIIEVNGVKRRCLHGLTREQQDDMADEYPSMTVKDYKKLRGINT